MQKLYIKQKVFSFKERFSVYNSLGEPVYNVVGELFTFGKKLHVTDLYNNELVFISQKVFSFLPRYFIHKNGIQIAEVVRCFTILKREFVVDGLNWFVSGKFHQHEYKITSPAFPVASVTKQWFTWGDTYEITIFDNVDVLAVLAVVLIIDAADHDAQAASSTMDDIN